MPTISLRKTIKRSKKYSILSENENIALILRRHVSYYYDAVVHVPASTLDSDMKAHIDRWFTQHHQVAYSKSTITRLAYALEHERSEKEKAAMLGLELASDNKNEIRNLRAECARLRKQQEDGNGDTT